MQGEAGMQMGDVSAQEHLEKVACEVSCERNAKEVLAFALARMLREARCSPPDQEQHSTARGSAQGMDELQDQLHRMSVQDSPPAGMRAAIVQQSITAARRILEMPASELSSRAPCPVSVAALRSALASAGHASTVACNHVELACMHTHASNGAPCSAWPDRGFGLQDLCRSAQRDRPARHARTGAGLTLRAWTHESSSLRPQTCRLWPTHRRAAQHPLLCCRRL